MDQAPSIKVEVGGGDKRVTITIDQDDEAFVHRYSWVVDERKASVYLKGPRNEYLHRQIARARIGEVVDHINGDTTDNRKGNLRLCGTIQNSWNMRSVRGSSRFKGVCWLKADSKWVSYISVNKRRYSLGRYMSEEDAALRYDQAALYHFGEYAYVNFPDRGTVPLAAWA